MTEPREPPAPRFFLVATPKTGNVWLECLLSKAYEIPVADLSGVWDLPSWQPPAGGFVTHQHFDPSPELLAWARRQGVRWVTLARHPADVFLSLYHYVNRFAEEWRRAGIFESTPEDLRAQFEMIGEDLDSPPVLAFLEGDFAPILGYTLGWLEVPGVPLVRYEELHKDPAAVLRRLATCAGAPQEGLTEGAITTAISQCGIQQLRARDKHMALHCRRGAVDGWRDELPETHRRRLAERYGDELEVLSYSLGIEENA